VVTRDEKAPKRYIQDLIEDGTIGEALPAGLDPAVTQVYACGNPAMIGLPDVVGDDAELRFPEPRGAAEILTGLGFTVDRRGVTGNVHYEEYW
jgi:ferredoxin--NADP+ reductase